MITNAEIYFSHRKKNRLLVLLYHQFCNIVIKVRLGSALRGYMSFWSHSSNYTQLNVLSCKIKLEHYSECVRYIFKPYPSTKLASSKQRIDNDIKFKSLFFDREIQDIFFVLVHLFTKIPTEKQQYTKF